MIDKRRAILSLLDELFLKVSPKFNYINGINCWPLFKIQIGYLLIFLNDDGFNKKSKETRLKFNKINVSLSELSKLLKAYFKVKILKKKFNNRCKGKVLVFGFDEHYYAQEGSLVNLYLTPFKKELDKLSVNYEELLITNNSYQTNRSELYNLYEYLQDYYRSLFNVKDVFIKNNRKVYQNACLVDEFLKEKDIEQSSYLADTIYKKQIEHEIKFNAFRHFLKIVKPKLIWTYCYYDNSVMAMIRAANELSIPNIEYQHSKQGNEHNAYSKWPNSDLYHNFFPKMFWVWKDGDKEIIMRNFSGTEYLPNVVVGGNLSSIHQKGNYVYNPDSEKGILVSLQGNWIPTFLEDVIEQDTKHIWYFRLHPRYPGDKDKLNDFKVKFPSKIEIDKANTLSIHQLFSLVKINVTDFSGVALEAADFGIKNIIIGETGHEIYKQEILSKKFSFYKSKDEFSEAINADTFYGTDKVQSNTVEQENLTKMISDIFTNELAA